MAIWQWALLALALLWGFQSLGVWFQMRHYSDVMKGITSKYSDGFVGAGHIRGRFGKGVIVLIVVDRNLEVRRFLQMSGRTVLHNSAAAKASRECASANCRTIPQLEKERLKWWLLPNRRWSRSVA